LRVQGRPHGGGQHAKRTERWTKRLTECIRLPVLIQFAVCVRHNERHQKVSHLWGEVRRRSRFVISDLIENEFLRF
jgi:hypothetical protein